MTPCSRAAASPVHVSDHTTFTMRTPAPLRSGSTTALQCPCGQPHDPREWRLRYAESSTQANALRKLWQEEIWPRHVAEPR